MSKAIVIALFLFPPPPPPAPSFCSIGEGGDERNIIQASFCHQTLLNKERLEELLCSKWC